MSKKRISVTIPPSAVILLLIVPLCNAVLRIVYSAVVGNVLYDLLTNGLSLVMYALSILSLYAGLGYVVRACLHRFPFVPYTVMYALGLILTYAGEIVSYRLFMTEEAFASALGYTLTTNLLNLGIEAVLFAVTILITNIASAKYGVPSASEYTKNPFKKAKGNLFVLIPVGICFTNSFAWAVASTIVDLVSVGPPINLTEVVYLASPYLLILVTAIFGTFTVSKVLR